MDSKKTNLSILESFGPRFKLVCTVLNKYVVYRISPKEFDEKDYAVIKPLPGGKWQVMYFDTLRAGQEELCESF